MRRFAGGLQGADPLSEMTNAKGTSGTTKRAWQRMLSGRRLDLLAPDPADIEISDIAHGLARVARWNGQTTGEHAFSVAQHCLLVEDIAAGLDPSLDRAGRLAALLHDAPEYVIGDLISPFKSAIGLDYKSFEERLLAAIHARFGLPPVTARLAALIKAADRVAAYHEATRLAGFSISEADLYFGPRAPLPQPHSARLERLESVPIAAAQHAYLVRFQALSGG